MSRQPSYKEVMEALDTPEGEAFTDICQELADHEPQLSDDEFVRRLYRWFEEQGWRTRRRLH